MIRLAEAEVLEVVDGDTLHTLLDIGWGIILRPRIGRKGGGGTIRVVHADGSPYDAPERGTARGKVAQAYARTLTLAGQKLTVVSYGIDDWGRTLGAVKLVDGRDWAELMEDQGHVK